MSMLLAFVLHVLAMTHNNWKHIRCKTCNSTTKLPTFYTSLLSRCYSGVTVQLPAFSTQLCIPNKALYPRHLTKTNVFDCLVEYSKNPDAVCAAQSYTKKDCYCDYSPVTKVMLATTTFAAFAIGLSIGISHILSVLRLDQVPNWLFISTVTLLIIGFICMLISLMLVGVFRAEDIASLIFSVKSQEYFSINASIVHDVGFAQWRQATWQRD
ncbi:unnamed protein product [Didymodactylos carnosus]|uniref:Uncharacterized protein n=1 Tax=Didymodactylos carnosus TaxID=1234261 RepID=A0A815Q650_9BILA|nr:unnamed protein product [Didymodactylos carnosus]CAF4329776.1 unnamed protein product [Didymodactylos carnosus]